MTPWRIISQLQDGESGYAIATSNGIFYCGRDRKSAEQIIRRRNVEVSKLEYQLQIHVEAVNSLEHELAWREKHLFKAQHKTEGADVK